ncbi:hypothetical protein LT330_006989 [Penicillium expansum]|uniref:hydroxymethylbilane synthase n=1 Tax=Penicillium expansum TaxID=27334 RepID=A0A0A2IK41_PENEN|nr:Porphobilinogen deaminase, N-terminal [Penicillium expansum]KAK4868787.1 hypothetical protein LT330_006989 [Penicillium expansum]KGO43439.1 Porphobilinogen deaminase, N-terminal [Penicillium expansum]KGO57335.1 Porphobilinogen deaminase, N-terminal [Penicillium expansum]KGO63343.1 Porphobilinogen deaminase, N-terminal [Penicillium expansum]
MSLNPNGSQPQHEKEDISSPDSFKFVVGCRKSELALTQTRTIISELRQKLDPSPTFEIATSSVVGDADKQTPFIQLSKQTGGSDIGKSLWTNGLEKDLAAGKVQFLIHCLKDMPTTLPPNFLLGAIPEREDCSDAVVMKSDSVFKTIDQLPPGSVVGSSSSRRRALVRRNWPHLEILECRGNLDTRLAKLDAPDSPFSCILLATAGLLRLGLGRRITQRLEPTVFPYAVGQGALGIELNTDRQDILHLVQHVDHKPSRWRGMAERAMLRSLQGGCSSSIGVWSSFEPLKGNVSTDAALDSGTLHLRATVIHIEGTSEISSEDVSTVQSDEEAEQLGISVVNMLLDKGVRDLLPEQL